MNEPQLLSIEDENPLGFGGSEQLLSISDTEKAMLPDDVVTTRSAKADFGLGEDSPGVDSLRNTIGRGDETYAREAAVSMVDKRTSEAHRDMITKVAAQSNGPVTPEDVALVTSLKDAPKASVDNVFESGFARQYMNRLALTKKESEALFNKALAEDPDYTLDTLNLGSSILANRQVVHTALEDLKARWDETGFWGKTGEFVEQVIPFKSDYNISKAAKDANTTFWALPGNTLGEKIQNMWTLDQNTFAKVFNESVKTIAESNILDAQQFANAVLGYSSSDAMERNFFTLLDVAGVGELAASVGKGAKALAAARSASRDQIKNAVKDAIKITEDGTVRPERVIDVMGDTEQAGKIRGLQKALAETTEIPAKTSGDLFRGILNNVTSIQKPMQVTDNMGSLSREFGTRLGMELERQALILQRGIIDPLQATRLTPEALAKGMDEAITKIRKDFTALNDSILDIRPNPRDLVTNTDSVHMRIGTPEAQTFGDAENALVHARDIYQLRDGTYSIRREGANFFIRIDRAIDETLPSVREAMVTKTNATPQFNDWATKMLGWIRSPAETTSELQRANRNIVTLAQENSLKFVKEVSESFKAIPKKQREDFNKIIASNREYVDPATGNRGMFHNSVGSLEEQYLTDLKRMPTEAEVKAYFSYVQLSDYDWVLRNTTMLRDKERLGLKQFSFEVGDKGYSEYGPLIKNETPLFEGKKVDYIPWNTDHLSVLIHDARSGTSSTISRNSSAEARATAELLVKEGGYEIVQVSNPLSRPFKEVIGNNEPIQYVISKKFDQTELNPKQVNYAPGGHVQYAHEFWVKQPKLQQGRNGTWFYEGDTVAFNFSSKAQADKFTKRMDEARLLLKAGDEAGLRAYLAKNLPYGYDSFKSLFSKDGYYDINQAFHTTSNGRRVADDVDFKAKLGNYKDYTTGEYNLTSELDRKFTGQRNQNAMTINEKGTGDNPVFTGVMGDATLLDPMSTLARSIGQATRSRYFGDMKISAAEQFIEEFGDMMRGVSKEELRSSPMYYLHNPPFDKNADPVRLAMARYTQRNAMTFAGEQTPFGRNLEWAKQKVVSNLYKAEGQQVADNFSTSALMSSRDPTSFFRGAAFHLKLGLFQVAQVFVQGAGFNHILALAPRQALPAAAAFTLQRSLMLNSSREILDGAARIASRMGWKQEHFKEAWELLQKSGFNNVGREAALIDDMSDPKLYKGAGKEFLDKGTVFFTETERFIRMSAYNAAYLEFRKANPHVAITNYEAGQILSRADTLSLNMTRASKSQMEQGIFSASTQFTSYAARMVDQMWGRQLSAAEKARVIGVNSAFFGVPSGATLATGIPFYEDVREAAIKAGVNVSDFWMNSVVEGLPATLMALATGKEFNIAQRLGPGGLSQIQLLRDMANGIGDKGMFDLLFGVSGSVTKSAIKSVSPVLSGLASVMEEGGSWAPVMADLIDASREISSVNAGLKLAMALNTGKYISKNDVYLDQMSSGDAWFSAITGISRRELSDSFIMSKDLKQTAELQKEAEKHFAKYYRRGAEEAAKGNREASDTYFKRANAYIVLSGIAPDQHSQWMKNAMQGQLSTVERINERWFRDAPVEKSAERLQHQIDRKKASEEAQR